ncbi:hypothetical protein [Natronospora cellulosivora (SeqCode)]
MDFYHGTTKAGLRELRPFASPYSNLKEPLVYLTTSKQLALHYIWNTDKLEIKMPMLDIRKDGVLVFQEMFSGALEYFYKGLSGYIYHCVGDYQINDNSDVFTCATSSSPVPILDYEYIDDVYEKIIEYQEKGTFIYEKYETLPQYRYDIIRGIIIRTIKRENLLNAPSDPRYKFYKEKFLQYWKEAEVLEQNGLL